MGNAPWPLGWKVHSGHERVWVALHGELDLATAPDLAGALAELRDAGYREIVVDLRALDFLGCAGLRCLLDAQRFARERGNAMVAFVPGPPPIQRMFELAGVMHAMTFYAGDA